MDDDDNLPTFRDATPAEREKAERDAAISRLKAKKGFQAHVVTYVAVNVLCVGIWAVSSRGYFWPIWVILPWGFGLAMHAWTLFGQKPITEDDIQREIERGGGATS